MVCVCVYVYAYYTDDTFTHFSDPLSMSGGGRLTSTCTFSLTCSTLFRSETKHQSHIVFLFKQVIIHNSPTAYQALKLRTSPTLLKCHPPQKHKPKGLGRGPCERGKYWHPRHDATAEEPKKLRGRGFQP